jgi:NAD+ kinase
VNKVGVIFHPHNQAACDLAIELEKHLAASGLDAWLCSAWEGDAARARVEGTDLILTVGGDGTILRAAQAVVPGSTPITGINLGNLGFMTELAADEAFDQLSPLLEGRGWVDERALLEAEVVGADAIGADAIGADAIGADTIGTDEEHHRTTFYALNDVVIAHGAVARLIRVEARVDGAPVTTYKADGAIVATATGSTGYALAAGGPILHPQSQELLLLPIVPHLSASYTLVLPGASVVELELVSRQPAALTVDGHITAPFHTGARLTVRRSEHTIRFLRVHKETSYYGSLESRLKGKQ